MLEDTISALDFNELPSRVRTDRANGIKLYTTSVLARGGNPEVALADENRIGTWSQLVNHTRALEDRGVSGLTSRLVTVAKSGANPYADEMIRKIPESLAPVIAELRGGVDSKGIVLADATTTGNARGATTETFMAPLRVEDFMPWLGRGREPVMGQMQHFVRYIDSTGKAGPAASVGAVKKIGTAAKQHAAPVRILACATDVDVIRMAEAAFNQNGEGYSLDEYNDLAANMAMRAALADVAINGDATVGWNGILSTGAVGKSRSITTYAAINVGTDTAAVVAKAIGNAIADALAGVSTDPETALDTVVISDTMHDKLGESTSGGDTYLTVLMKHWQSRGIVNWHVSDAIRSEDKSVQRMIVTRSAEGKLRPRLLAPLNPQVFTYVNGAHTETYYFAPCAGVWNPFQAVTSVINMVWSA